MRVFVTGGAGYIGSVTAAMLLDAGHETVVFDNFERGHRSAVDPRARLVEGDLRNREVVANALRATRPDAVIHFAAYALVGESMESPEMYFGNNVRGGINLADAMLEHGVGTIVFSSTCATYGQPDKVPIVESAVQCPTNPYGASKLMLEQILEWISARHGTRCVFLRYFNACGAARDLGEDHNPETHLIPNILRAASGRAGAVKIFGNDYATPDGTCIRDYIHIEDLARAHIMALTGGARGAFNLGTGRGYSVMEILETARRVTGSAIPAKIEPRRPGDPARLVADASKAAAVLGWHPTASDIENIIATAWNWHRRHPEGYGD